MRYLLLVLALSACGVRANEAKVVKTADELSRDHHVFTFESCKAHLWEAFPQAKELRQTDLVLLEGGVLRMSFQVWNGARPPQSAVCDVTGDGVTVREG